MAAKSSNGDGDSEGDGRAVDAAAAHVANGRDGERGDGVSVEVVQAGVVGVRVGVGGVRGGDGGGDADNNVVVRTLSRRTTATMKRQSTGDRLNEILETALQRAETMDPDALTLLRRKSSHQMNNSEDYQSSPVNETTGIMSRGGSGQGYQTVVSSRNRDGSYGGDERPRSRKLAYVGGDGGGKTEQQGGKRGDQLGRRRVDGGGGGSSSHSSAEDSDTETATESGPPAWQRVVNKFHSLELENKGSVARDHLALERTFLAWLRTSLAFASIGVAVTQLFRLNVSLDAEAGVDHDKLRQMGRPLGATFLAISIVTLLLGAKRYFRAQEWILKGKFPASRGTVLVMAFIALALMVVSLVVVIVIQPSQH